MDLHLAQAATEPTGGLAGWAVGLVDSLGGFGVAVISALDNMLSIVPADLVLPLVGFSATQGAIGLGAAAAWSTAGSVMGSLALYTLGALLGRDRSQALLTKIPGFRPKIVDRAEAWFTRHGAKAVLFGRMLPGIRTLISLPAGIERMSLPKFVVLTAIGSLMWNSTLLLAGYLLGANWHLASNFVNVFQFVVIGAVVLAIVLLVVKRVRAKRSSADGGSSREDVDPEQRGRGPGTRLRGRKENQVAEERARAYDVSVAQVALNWLISFYGDTVVAIPRGLQATSGRRTRRRHGLHAHRQGTPATGGGE